MKLPIIDTPAYHMDNGFMTREAQERAHGIVLQAIEEACRGLERPKVLDLGCGNGALLAKAMARVPGLQPFGVEINTAVVPHWAEVIGLPEADRLLWVGDLFAFPFPEAYDVALLMPGRLIERPVSEGSRLVDALRQRVKRTVVYAYGDWIRRYGGLAGLVRAARIPADLGPVYGGPLDVAQAAVVNWHAA